jgi:beta-phosphoglucomutase-like phosphatase (HAD superfamily)
VSESTATSEPLNIDAVEVILCDADGNLFGSEEPAFVASTMITNRLLAEMGVARSFTPDALRRRAMGRNFRATALDLAAEAGVAIDHAALEGWVEMERQAVVAHLGAVLRPDPAVHEPLRALAQRYRLALVSSSATSRIAVCLAATALDDLFPPQWRFSAEDSLPAPTSKPDPAIYAFAGRKLGITGAAGLAVEDAVAGVQSAVAAGFPTLGNVQFTPAAEAAERTAALHVAGAIGVLASWSDLLELLGDASIATRRD